MRTLVALTIAALLVPISQNALADGLLNFTHVKTEGDLSSEDKTYLGYEAQIPGYSAGWNGIIVSKFNESNKKIYMADKSTNVLHIGTTKNGGDWDPETLPESCQVVLEPTQTLNVFGTLTKTEDELDTEISYCTVTETP